MAELIPGPSVYSYNLTVETPIDIDEMIYMLSPTDLPLLQGVNADGMPVLPSSPTGDTTFYWMEETVPLPRGVLNVAATNVATTLTLNAGNAVKFAVGDAIRIDDEVMIITAINVSTDVITVTRGSATETNTTAVSHLAASEVLGMGSLLIEGAVGSANFQGRDKYSNYCQIWSKKLTMSRTEQAIKKYGVPSELARQTANMMQHYGVGQEQAALYGVKFQQAGTNRRQTGGLNHFIVTNNDTTTPWLTVDNIEARQQISYDNGGMFDLIVARPAAFGALNNVGGNERITTVTIDDARRGRHRASTVMTEFGEVGLCRNRWVRRTDAFGVKVGNFKLRKLRPSTLEKLAKTDDTDSFLIVTEAGFQVKGEAHMAKWTGLSTASAMPADLV